MTGSAAKDFADPKFAPRSGLPFNIVRDINDEK